MANNAQKGAGSGRDLDGRSMRAQAMRAPVYNGPAETDSNPPMGPIEGAINRVRMLQSRLRSVDEQLSIQLDRHLGSHGRFEEPKSAGEEATMTANNPGLIFQLHEDLGLLERLAENLDATASRASQF